MVHIAGRVTRDVTYVIGGAPVVPEAVLEEGDALDGDAGPHVDLAFVEEGASVASQMLVERTEPGREIPSSM